MGSESAPEGVQERAHPALTVGQQVEHQLLVSTEAGIVPDGRGRGHRQARRPACRPAPPVRPARHSQWGAVPPVPHVHLHISLLQQVPG